MTAGVRVTRRSLTLAVAAAVLIGVALLAGPVASAPATPTAPASWLASDGGGTRSPDPVPSPSGEPDDADDAAGEDGQATQDGDGDRFPRSGIEVEAPSSGITSSDPATVDQESGGDELSADQVSRTSESTPDDGPIGLLALIAIVCVVGAAAGAVRVLISQWANHGEWA